MVFRILAIVFWAVLGSFHLALAQEQAWIQVEALPSLKAGEERARAYSETIPNVTGFQISAGWYAVALGPYSPDQVVAARKELKRQGLIPRDAFITDGAAHRQQFWPVGQVSAPEDGQATDPAAVDPAVVNPATAEVPELTAESLKDSKAAEAALTKDERKDLQTALGWYGFYAAAVDGSFGAGTRKSMAAWQEAKGFEPSGVLSSEQRAQLIGGYKADLAEFGFEAITEAEAGIAITLPMSLVQFDRYEPPFVHFSEKNASGVQIMLISEPGDKSALFGLYDILQTLEVVPATGERSRDDSRFTINASSDEVQSFAYAEAVNGTIKGYLVVWKPSDAARMARILPVLKASFAAAGAKALDPGLVPMDEATRSGLLAGLEVKTPKLSRSGFYVDAAGDVVTTVEAVAQCGRVTIDMDAEAEVLEQDAATGIAVLRPLQVLAPAVFARLRTGGAHEGSEVAVAGYSYEGKLPAPVLSFGTLAENAGLKGEAGMSRLAVALMAGDAGGPVLDGTGAVIGMALPVAVGAKILPEGVGFAAQSSVISKALAEAGITAEAAAAGDLATPDALQAAGMGMTVLVSCWE